MGKNNFSSSVCRLSSDDSYRYFVAMSSKPVQENKRKLKFFTKIRLKLFKYIFPKEHEALCAAMDHSRVVFELVKRIVASEL